VLGKAPPPVADNARLDTHFLGNLSATTLSFANPGAVDLIGVTAHLRCKWMILLGCAAVSAIGQ
jgi:hypothetical protein